MPHDLDALLRALDPQIQTVEDLEARLGWDRERVETALAAGIQEGLVLDWSPDYATSWAAKRRLHLRFFRRAVPASAALGAHAGAVFLVLQGGLTPLLAALALTVIGATLGFLAHRAPP